MGKNKFTVIDHQADADANSGLLTRSLDMYEVSTAKVLKGEASEISIEEPNEVLHAFHGYWFVIAINSDIHFFDVSVGCTEFNPDSSKGRIESNKNAKDKRIFILPENARVVSLQFIPSTDVLLILLSNGTIFFGSSTNRLSHKLKDLIPPVEKCAVCIAKTSGGGYSVAISDCKGMIYFLTIPQFDAGIHDEEQFRRVFSLVQKCSFDLGQIPDIYFIANVMNSFVFFPKRKDATVYASSLHLSAFSKFTALFTLKEDVQMVRTVGAFVCVLKNNSQLAFFDQNLILLHVLLLVSKEENCVVLDFEFLDVDEYCEFTETVKILLKVKADCEHGYEFKIKQFNEADSQFSRQCSERAVLVPFSTPGDENNIIYIDAFPSSSPNDIFVRFVGEAQPSLRLKKLIELKRFDDALAFAKSYDLPADLVYVELLLFYQEQIQTGKDGSYEEETFKDLLNTFRMISDHNTAGDQCVAVLNFVNQYDHIKTILDFAKSLKITDLYTQKEISRFRYELASYRMLFAPRAIRFDRESQWSQFLSSGSHKEFFDGFCEAGQMTEARILLSRYSSIARELQDEKAVKKLLTTFKRTLTEKPQISGAISEFVEVEFIPIILNSNNLINSKTICSTFCDFFIDVSLLLEKLEPKNFPRASLYFAETFNRAIELLRTDCHTSDKHVTFLHILKQLDDCGKDGGILGRLNVLIRNLKKLCKIHTVYECTMSYSEFLSHDVHSICHRIMDRIRTTTSVREIVEQFVFPYVEEHGLDRNKILYDYIKQIANSYHSYTAGQAHTWDLLCLQITEQITDANVRCRAIIEIASGAVPPWSPQLSKVVRAVIAQGDKIDPELINSLRKQCLYADLGLIFIRYEIPLSNRSRVIGGAGLRSLLQYIFKNSRRDMALKLHDAFTVVELYEDLQSKQLFTAVDCYYLYAVVLIKQMKDEDEMKSLTALFQLIKSSQEAESVALKLITHLKCLLTPTKIKSIVAQRLVWLGCLLCVAERYLNPLSATTSKLICDARAIRQLQIEYQILIGFSTFREKDQCVAHLKEFIDVPNAKSIVQVHNFGSLLSLDIKDICKAIIGVYIKNGVPEAALDTLRYLTSVVHLQTKAHLIIALDTCFFVCWKLTESVRDEFPNEDRIEFARSIVHGFQSVLPKLIDWSVNLEEIRFFESFSKISRYVDFFNLVLTQCSSIDDALKSSDSDPSVADISSASVKSISEIFKGANKLYVTKTRTGVLLSHLEGTLYNTGAIVKAVCDVASSVVESPVDGKLRDEFHEQMREHWYCLFDHLSGSHILLEIQARKLANSLDCFTSTDGAVLLGIERNVLELCKKIFSFPIADIQLAAHLLLSLPADEMRKNLQELRRWVQSRKNVRNTLNLICVSLFVLIVANQDSNIIRQVVSWLETTQWQKRLVKQNFNVGAKQLKRDNIYDLLGEFAKILLPSSFLHEFCKETNCTPSAILLNYAVELCKLSSTLTLDASRFELCIETAKAAISSVDMDERTMMVLMMTVKDICPYNYEAIELLFNTMHEIVVDGKIERENPDFVRIKDGYMLLKFLRCTPRGKSISSAEIRWFKQFTNQKNWASGLNISMSNVTSTELTSSDETIGAPRFDDSTAGPVRQLSNLLPSNDSNSILPKATAKRLPFHLLFNEENEADKFQSKLIYHELTIFNLQHWTSLIEETTSILQHSRSHLLVGSISNHVNETMKFKRELCIDDICQIKQLVCDYPRLSILKALASRFQRLSLSQTKISLMRLCCEVIEEWLRNFEDEEMKSKEERIACESYNSALRESLVVIETEFLLANYGVLNADTVLLTQKSQELVNYLLCRDEIDWEEKDSISRYFEIIDSISQIHSVDVEGVFLMLIDRWVIESQERLEQAIPQITSDPDSTIDFTGPSVASNPSNNDEAEFSVPVLYDDPQTTRIIVLLRRIRDPMKKIMEFSHKSEIDVSVLPGGYNTKIRIACCILRFMTDEQMKCMFNITIDQFYGNFVTLLNQRLYSLCRIDLPIKDLKEADKRVEFVRIILSPQSVYRQTPEIARLLVCLIIDNDIDDLTTLGKAAQRLVQLRLSKPLLELLKYLRNIKGKDIRTIPNLSIFFAKTFEAFFDKIDTLNDRKELASLVLFLISCPLEGEGHFARSVSLLVSAGASFASSLVAISDNSTAEVDLVNEKGKMADLFGEI